MNTLLGSAPQAKFSTQPTGDAAQTGQIPDLISLISQQFAQNAPGAAQVTGEAQGALPAALNYQAPQVNAGQAFDQGVVQPMTTDFLQRALPAIAGNFGRGAGGAFGSGSAQARDQAGVDTTRAIAQQGAQFQLSTDIANQQAANQGAQIRNSALSLAPGTASIAAASQQPTLQDLLTAILTPTQTTLGVGNQGSTGLIQGLLGGGLGLGLGAATGPLLAQLLGPTSGGA